MGLSFRTIWNVSRHWVAAGFLISTSLFLLLMFLNWRSEHRGIASLRATGLSAIAGSPAPPLLSLPSLALHGRHQSTRPDSAARSVGSREAYYTRRSKARYRRRTTRVGTT